MPISDPSPEGAIVPSTAPNPPPPSPVKAAESRNNRKLWMLASMALVFALLGGAILTAFFTNKAGLKKRTSDVAQAAKQKIAPGQVPLLQRSTGIENQGFAAARPAREQPVAPVSSTPPPTAQAAPVDVSAPVIPAAMSATARRNGSRSKDASKEPAHTIRGVVPSYQVIPCKLVGALESGRTAGYASGGGNGGNGYGSGNMTSIKALVDEDIRTWDTHEIIIPKGTQCNTVGRFQQGRDRVFVDTDFTFILPGKGYSRTPLELVLPGIAQDREYDAAVDTWSLTDLSDGIRGDFIQTSNWNEVLLFTTKFLSGASSALSATSPSSFGQAYSNGSTSTATSLPGYAINPAVSGTQAVLDQEAQRISERIEQDGYFLRVPAHKQFYVLVRRGFSMADALPSGQAASLRAKHEDDALRTRDERIARERAAENGSYNTPGIGAVNLPAITDPNVAALLSQANNFGGGLRRPGTLMAPAPFPTPVPTPGMNESDALPTP